MEFKVSDWLGVDVGWVNPATDSEGKIYTWVVGKASYKTSSRCGPVTIRRADGSVTVKSPYNDWQLEDAMLAKGIRQDRCEAVAIKLVGKAWHRFYGLAVENWLNDERRDARWRVVWDAIANRAHARGVPLVLINPSYTSQDCASCGHRDSGNRQTRDWFRCLGCGHEDHADRNAAKNLAARARAKYGVDTDLAEVVKTKGDRCLGCSLYRPEEEFWRGLKRVGRCKQCKPPVSQTAALKPMPEWQRKRIDTLIARNRETGEYYTGPMRSGTMVRWD